MKPLFSIITVSFNSAKTIDRTIKSIISQTFEDYEYIIIDGGSTDGTIEVIKENENIFKGKLKWISERDNGIYNAMNKGIMMSTGKLIGIVNSDDWLEPDALETIVKVYRSHNDSLKSVYCGWINFVYDNKKKNVLKTNWTKFENKAKKYYTLDGVRHPAVFVPKELYNKYGLFDERIKISADADFLHRLFFSDIRFIFIEKIISNMSDGGISNNRFNISVQNQWYNDYKIRIEKFNLSKFRRFFLLFRFRTLQIIKGVIPNSILKYYRETNCCS